MSHSHPGLDVAALTHLLSSSLASSQPMLTVRTGLCVHGCGLLGLDELYLILTRFSYSIGLRFALFGMLLMKALAEYIECIVIESHSGK